MRKKITSNISFYSLLSFLLAVVSFSQNARATHIVGGEMNYKYLGGDNYEIILTVYRDCKPGSIDFDQIASIGAFNSSNQLVKELKTPLRNRTKVPFPLLSPCFKPPTNICYEVTTYIDTMSLPPIPGGYQLVYQRCCRNSTVINIVKPLETGGTYYATIPDTAVVKVNSNPVFKAWPPVFMCAGMPFSFDHSATDLDGDSLVYELYVPYEGAYSGTAGSPCPIPIPCTPQPQPPYDPPYNTVVWNPPFSFSNMLGGVPLKMDSATGLLTAVPNTIGQFVVGMKVKEYRNGVLISETKRDYEFNVVDCPKAILASIQAPLVQCGNNTVKFQNFSSGGTNYTWEFNDPASTGDTSNAFEPTYTYSDTGVYKVKLIVRDNSNPPCTDTSYSTVRLYPPFNTNFYYQTQACSNNVLFFDSSYTNYGNIINWQWTFGDLKSSTIEDPTHIYTQSGTYNVRLISSSDKGCKDTAIKPVTILGPIISSGSSLVNCGDSTVQFTGTSVGAAPLSYQWHFGDNSSSNQKDPSHTYSDTGSYTVTLISQYSSAPTCPDTAELKIKLYPPLEADYTEKLTPCGNTVDFKDSSSQYSGTITSWNWNFGDNTTSTQANPSHTYSQPGTYDITLITKTNNGCTDTVIGQIIIPSINPSVQGDTICLGEVAQLQASGGIAYSWSPSAGLSNATIANPVTIPNVTTTYTVSITTLKGKDTCVVDLSTTVYVHQTNYANITLSADEDTIIKGSSTQLHLEPKDSTLQYSWLPANSLDNPASTDPVASPTVTTTYTVSLNDSNDCSSNKTITIVVVSDICDDPHVYVPNAFTPNNDNSNDILYVRGYQVEELYFAVYNRWGEKVFETTNQNIGWDGNYQGMQADPAVFAYYLKVRCVNKQEFFKKGNVTLIR